MNTAPKPQSLYESAEKIHARSVWGRYARLRVLAAVVLLGLYYGVPWLQWGERQAVLFDLPARRFHLFGLTLFPQDLILLSALLAVAALTLFFATSLGGRLWCGYACPQTVWTEAFMWIEHLFEGDRHQRIKLDKSRWNAKKILRRGGKHLAWLLFGLYTGLTFVSFFVPAREVFSDALHLRLEGWALFWGVFYALATWGFAGFMREQVCKYMCPYARFQSAMFDRDTLIIAYDEQRGEPRKGAQKAVGKTSGDCIDCTLCVQVCPVGIDIRKGLQYECIACAACVDACNSVMDHVQKPRGLIRYTSENHDAGQRFHLFRPRTIGYGLIWVALLVGFSTLVLTRSPVGLDVLRDRKQLYRELADGSIANVYTLKIANKTDAPVEFQIQAIDAAGQPLALSGEAATVGPSATEAVVVGVMMPGDQGRGVQTITFVVTRTDNPDVLKRHEARFIGKMS